MLAFAKAPILMVISMKPDSYLTVHYNDVIMSTMASQITSLTIVYLAVSVVFGRRSKKTSKLRVTGLCAGNSSGTGEFPAQMGSSAENVSIWWRHRDRRIYTMATPDKYECDVQYILIFLKKLGNYQNGGNCLSTPQAQYHGSLHSCKTIMVFLKSQRRVSDSWSSKACVDKLLRVNGDRKRGPSLTPNVAFVVTCRGTL